MARFMLLLFVVASMILFSQARTAQKTDSSELFDSLDYAELGEIMPVEDAPEKPVVDQEDAEFGVTPEEVKVGFVEVWVQKGAAVDVDPSALTKEDYEVQKRFQCKLEVAFFCRKFCLKVCYDNGNFSCEIKYCKDIKKESCRKETRCQKKTKKPTTQPKTG